MRPEKPDRLSALIHQFRVKTTVLPVGACVAPRAVDGSSYPNLFILDQRCLQIFDNCLSDIADQAPVLVFFPRGAPNGLIIDVSSPNSNFICATVDAGGDTNPISTALPEIVTVQLDTAPALRAVCDILFDEAQGQRCGGHAVIDRLCEIVVIQLLRHLIEKGDAEVGLIAGLAHPNLSHALTAIHNKPQHNWHLEDLAELSGMSRAHFANSFKTVLGVTAGEYLSNWRLTLARMEIAKGTVLKSIVAKVGFSSSSALSRAFKRRYGVSPRQDVGSR